MKIVFISSKERDRIDTVSTNSALHERRQEDDNYRTNRKRRSNFLMNIIFLVRSFESSDPKQVCGEEDVLIKMKLKGKRHARVEERTLREGKRREGEEQRHDSNDRKSKWMEFKGKEKHEYIITIIFEHEYFLTLQKICLLCPRRNFWSSRKNLSINSSLIYFAVFCRPSRTSSYARFSILSQLPLLFQLVSDTTTEMVLVNPML